MDRRSLLKAAMLAGGAGASALATPPAAEARPAAPARGRATVAARSGGGVAHGPALQRLTAYIDQHRAAYNLPGLTMTLTDRSGFSAHVVAGFADTDRGALVTPAHVFEIGSISKSFVALCIFRQIEAGRLKLSDRIVDVLPGVALPPASPVTVQNLLSHSGGLPDDAPLFPRVEGGRLWSDFTPGSRWSYSNTGYDILGVLLEHQHGKTLRAILETEVLAPLGMAGAHGHISGDDRALYATGYRPFHADRPYPLAGPLGTAPWVDVTFGAGCIAATAPQMTRYLAWLIAAAAGKGAPLLSDAAAARYLAPVIDAPDWAPKARYANGLAIVDIGGRSLLHHTGGMIAYSSAFHVDGAAGVGAFASTNVGMTGYRPRDITSYACALLRWARDGGAEPTPTPLPSADVPKPADFAGVFTAPDGETITIAVAGKGLTLTAAGETQILRPRGPDMFLAGQERFSRYGFLAERRDGKVRSFWWGPVEFAADPAAPRRPVDPELALLAGRYDNDDPWSGAVRVVARPTGLWADGMAPLTRRPDGSWRFVGDPSPPERLVFDAPLAGRPSRLNASGTDYLRRAE
jgi:D-alanyl-D-alanine carboxypeptidase